MKLTYPWWVVSRRRRRIAFIVVLTMFLLTWCLRFFHKTPPSSPIDIRTDFLQSENMEYLLGNVPVEQLKIYVYDMPHELTHQIAARKPWCENNAFGTEIYLHEAFLASPHRTLNPDEAHLFYVPVYAACLVYRNFALFPEYRQLVQSSFNFIATKMPYFNRSLGRDHIVTLVHDFGACLSWNIDNHNVQLEPLRNVIVLSHLGDITIRCFNTHKDIVIPPFVSEKELYEQGRGGVPSLKKEIFCYFRGTIEWYHPHSIPEQGIQRGNDPVYSNGVRQTIYQLYKDDPLFMIQQGSSTNYSQELSQSLFCLCPRGFATWSRRLFDAVMMGCIPVIIADGIELPFEAHLNYNSFTIKLKQSQVPHLKQILLSISPQQILSKQITMRRIWKSFTYQRPPEPGDALDLIFRILATKARPFPPVAYRSTNSLTEPHGPLHPNRVS